MLRFLIIVFFSLIFACGESALEPPPTQSRAQGLGEQVGEYPSLAERRVLYLTNRARTEPGAFNAEDPQYAPTRPLRWDFLLSQAARFHAGHILDANCWCEDHSSCCQLEGSGEDVSCGGPVTGCGAMSTADRVALWSPKYSGENMAMGQTSAQEVVDGWINSPGHWANINSSVHTLLGTGNITTGWVQDFGNDGGNPPVIGDGIHLSNGQSTLFGITYYQPSSEGPRTALVIVDGECHDLTLSYGTAQSGAFETSVTLGQTCARYYFHFTDGNGNDITYPSTGSLGVGNNDCPLYSPERPADTCSPSGQACMTGFTRSCYTGPFGTRDLGVCTSGVERCVAGQWTGDCMNEVQPLGDEVCGNADDENCNGEVDEGCMSEDDGDDSGGDMLPDVVDSEDKNPTSSDSDSGGCSIAARHQGKQPLLLMLALIATIWPRRRMRY